MAFSFRGNFDCTAGMSGSTGQDETRPKIALWSEGAIGSKSLQRVETGSYQTGTEQLRYISWEETHNFDHEAYNVATPLQTVNWFQMQVRMTYARLCASETWLSCKNICPPGMAQQLHSLREKVAEGIWVPPPPPANAAQPTTKSLCETKNSRNNVSIEDHE